MKKVLFIIIFTIGCFFNCEKSQEVITGYQPPYGELPEGKIQIVEIKHDYNVTCIGDTCIYVTIGFPFYNFETNSNNINILRTQNEDVISGNWGRILLFQEMTLYNDWLGTSGDISPVSNIPDSINIICFNNYNNQTIQVTNVTSDGTLFIKIQNKPYCITSGKEISFNTTKKRTLFQVYQLLVHDTIRIINHGYYDKNNIIFINKMERVKHEKN